MTGPCMCGAFDCVACRGEEAISYSTQCANCDESGADCECGTYERKEYDYYPDAGDLY